MAVTARNYHSKTTVPMSLPRTRDAKLMVARAAPASVPRPRSPPRARPPQGLSHPEEAEAEERGALADAWP